MQQITNQIPNNEYKKTAQIEQNQYISPKQNDFYNVSKRLQEIIENFFQKEEKDTLTAINDKFLELDFGAEFDINADKIGVNDAIFFINLLNQQNLINYTIEDDKLNISDFNNKKINATSPLLSMLQSSLESKKPIRLDFENNITVILKLDKEGKIQAHFIPGTSEVESYLKNNIPSLKQRFDDENINYSSLGYSKYKDENKNNKNQKENKKR